GLYLSSARSIRIVDPKNDCMEGSIGHCGRNRDHVAIFHQGFAFRIATRIIRVSPKGVASARPFSTSALYMRSVCLLNTALHRSYVSSADLHVVETRFLCGFDSFRAHHLFNQLARHPSTTTRGNTGCS